MFEDRKDAGRQLAEKINYYANKNDIVVLALPRGGVPVAYQVAQKLNLPLDVFLVRKIGVPYNKEMAMGAISSGGITVLDQELIEGLNISAHEVQKVISKEQEELEYRDKLYRASRPKIDLAGLTTIVIDDGMATGATMEVAVKTLREQKVKEIIVAVPVASDSAYDKISQLADKTISLFIPPIFTAVGSWYRNFDQVSNEEVIKLLREE